MADDTELLHRFVSHRDEPSFTALVHRHVDGVFSAALRRVGGDVHLAEDVSQRVFTILARKAHLATRQPVLSAWLYTVTRYEAAHVVRAEQRRKQRERHAQAMNDLTRDSVHIDWSQVAPLLDTSIDRLGERDRLAIIQRFIERKAFSEIGTTLRVSEDAARMRVDRALEKLRRILEQNGVVSTSAALALTLSSNIVSAAPASLSTRLLGAAVISAPTASTPVTLFHLMSATKIGFTLAAVAIAIAIFQYHAAHERRPEAAGRQQSAAARARVSSSSPRAGASRTRANASAPGSPARAPAPMRPPVAARTGKSPSAEVQAGRMASLQIVSMIYGPLLDKLNLTGEARKRFLDLVCDERQRAYDVVSIANGEKLSYLTDPQIERMAIDAATSADPELQHLLTADDFATFVDYRNMHIIQVSVAKLADTIAERGGTPLTDPQVQGLIRIFFDSLTPGQLRRAPVNAVLNLGGVGVTEPVINAARTVLSEPQLAALREVRVGQLAPRRERLGNRPQPAPKQ